MFRSKVEKARETALTELKSAKALANSAGQSIEELRKKIGGKDFAKNLHVVEAIDLAHNHALMIDQIVSMTNEIAEMAKVEFQQAAEPVSLLEIEKTDASASEKKISLKKKEADVILLFQKTKTLAHQVKAECKIVKLLKMNTEIQIASIEAENDFKEAVKDAAKIEAIAADISELKEVKKSKIIHTKMVADLHKAFAQATKSKEEAERHARQLSAHVNSTYPTLHPREIAKSVESVKKFRMQCAESRKELERLKEDARAMRIFLQNKTLLVGLANEIYKNLPLNGDAPYPEFLNALAYMNSVVTDLMTAHDCVSSAVKEKIYHLIYQDPEVIKFRPKKDAGAIDALNAIANTASQYTDQILLGDLSILKELNQHLEDTYFDKERAEYKENYKKCCFEPRINRLSYVSGNFRVLVVDFMQSAFSKPHFGIDLESISPKELQAFDSYVTSYIDIENVKKGLSHALSMIPEDDKREEVVSLRNFLMAYLNPETRSAGQSEEQLLILMTNTIKQYQEKYKKKEDYMHLILRSTGERIISPPAPRPTPLVALSLIQPGRYEGAAILKYEVDSWQQFSF